MLSTSLGLKYEGDQSAGMMHGKGVLRNIHARCDEGSGHYTFSRQNDFWFYRYEGEFVNDKLAKLQKRHKKCNPCNGEATFHDKQGLTIIVLNEKFIAMLA